MTDKDKIEYLLNLLKTQEFNMKLEGAHSLVLSYKWLLDKLKQEESKK